MYIKYELVTVFNLSSACIEAVRARSSRIAMSTVRVNKLTFKCMYNQFRELIFFLKNPWKHRVILVSLKSL